MLVLRNIPGIPFAALNYGAGVAGVRFRDYFFATILGIAPSKFVISPNAPVRQVWVSALSRSFKLSWSDEAKTFVLDGETLDALLDRLVRQFLDG